MPAKNGCALIYYTPFTPNLYFGSAINFLIKSAACGLTSASFGMTRYFLQFCILCHVSLGSSDANGGYPTNISYNMTPIDHQSTVSVYPTILYYKSKYLFLVPMELRNQVYLLQKMLVFYYFVYDIISGTINYLTSYLSNFF